MSRYNEGFEIHVSSDKKKWAATVIAFLLIIGVLLWGILTGWDFIPKQEEELPDVPQDQTQLGGNMEIDDATEGYFDDDEAHIDFAFKVLSRDEYPIYGISPLANTGIIITATVTPEGAEDDKLVWSLPWKNPSSAWASGKETTDYVQLSISGDTHQATLSALQPFAEKLVLSAAVDGNPSVASEPRDVNFVQGYAGAFSATIEYTNTSASNRNVTWDLDASNGMLQFPAGNESSYQSFVDYFSVDGAKKGNYTVTVNTSLGEVYTKAATVTNVKISFSASSTYAQAVNGNGAGFTTNAGVYYLASTEGTGAAATVSGIDFVKIFNISSGEEMDFVGFKRQLKAWAGGPDMFKVKLEATINGEAQVWERNYRFVGDFGTFSSGVDIGQGDIDLYGIFQ